MDAVQYFSWVDYLVLAGLLSVNVALGIYYGCFGSKQNTAEEYLHGGKKMKPFPIAMSLTASYVSGITLLGVPTEIYMYGTQFMACAIAILLLMLAINFVFLPVYYKLQLPSSFEYLKLRFGHSTRSLASLLYVLATIANVPILIYIPSLALSHVTGFSVHVISPAICALCIFYTTLGGLKAVVISDTIQFSITILTMATIFIFGTYLSGGFVEIWEKAKSGDRIEFFNMSLDPTIRQTFWGVTIGMGVTFIGNMGINPANIQRFLSLPTYGEAKRSVIYYGIGSILAKVLSGFTGLIMFARYMDCDPFSMGKIKKIDQLLPYYVLEAMGNWTGFPGLFVASVLCTALSAMSTCINTLSLTIYEDFLKAKLPKDMSERTISIILKSIVVITGVISLALIFVVEKLGGIVEIALSFHGLSWGPQVGVTVLGMLFPYANEKGALTGGICSMVLICVIFGGAKFYTIQGIVQPIFKPLSTAGCDFLNNTLLEPTRSSPELIFEKPPTIFIISYLFYALISATLAIIIGLFVSWLTKKEDDLPVHKDLLSPCIYRFLSDGSKYDTELELYKYVESPLIKVQNVKEITITSKFLDNNIKQ